MQVFLESALGRRVDMVCLEDNKQCLGAIKSGYSAALRSLPRTGRILLSVAHGTFMLTPGNEIRRQPTDTHKGDVFTSRSAWSRPSSRQCSTCWVCDASEPTGSAASRATVDLSDYDLNIYSFLLDLVFDMFVVSFDMSLLIFCQSELNSNQFDLNFGLIIYSYSGQFASTATKASSSTSNSFL